MFSFVRNSVTKYRMKISKICKINPRMFFSERTSRPGPRPPPSPVNTRRTLFTFSSHPTTNCLRIWTDAIWRSISMIRTSKWHSTWPEINSIHCLCGRGMTWRRGSSCFKKMYDLVEGFSSFNDLNNRV